MKPKKNLSPEKQMRDMLKAMATMNKRMGSIQMGKSKSKQSNNPPAMAMSPLPSMPNVASAICSRCGHVFKPEKPIKECPECGLTVAEEIDGEIDWTEEMKEPIPQFVYNSQSPEEIFYKSIRWYYQKWIAKFKGNPSSRIK